MDGRQAETAVAEALRERGLDVHRPLGEPRADHDLVVDPGGARLWIRYRSLVDHDAAARLLAETPPSSGVLLVVGDRVTRAARDMLLSSRAGYYDLRGHLALRTAHLVIDTDVDPLAGPRDRKDPLAGKAGLEVATALLMSRTSGTSVRHLARVLDRSPSTVSEVLKALRRDDLVDDRLQVIGTRLFWRLAEGWPTSRTYLSEEPPRGEGSRVSDPLRLGLGEAQNSVGWALTDSAAAVAYQAPLAVRSDLVLDFYVPDQITLRRAEQLLGAAPSPSQARCAIRVGPVPAVCARRVDVGTNPYSWPLAHRVFVALDLAQDTGRGREILDAWTPPDGEPRVW